MTRLGRPGRCTLPLASARDLFFSYTATSTRFHAFPAAPAFESSHTYGSRACPFTIFACSTHLCPASFTVVDFVLLLRPTWLCCGRAVILPLLSAWRATLVTRLVVRRLAAPLFKTTHLTLNAPLRRWVAEHGWTLPPSSPNSFSPPLHHLNALFDL